MRRAGLLLLGVTAIACGGCGGSGETQNRAARRLEREDLIAVSRALLTLEGPVAEEVRATKAAWPLIVHGLPTPAFATPPAALASAASSAATTRTPALLEEADASSLTGPGAQLAGLFRSFTVLARTGWKLILAAIDQIAHGSPGVSHFARANVALYIESVYDAHFELAQIGKKLLAGYMKLGGPRAFGAALSEAEVDELARTYSEAADRLHPHVGVRLGS